MERHAIGEIGFDILTTLIKYPTESMRARIQRIFNPLVWIAWIADSLKAATGCDWSPEELREVGERSMCLERAFNIRHGLTKDMEAPSVRYGSTPVDGPAQGKSIGPHWEDLRRNYYDKMGWDPETGIPLPETLTKTGLSHLIPDLSKTNERGGL